MWIVNFSLVAFCTHNEKYTASKFSTRAHSIQISAHFSGTLHFTAPPLFPNRKHSEKCTCNFLCFLRKQKWDNVQVPNSAYNFQWTIFFSLVGSLFLHLHDCFSFFYLLLFRIPSAWTKLDSECDGNSYKLCYHLSYCPFVWTTFSSTCDRDKKSTQIHTHKNSWTDCVKYLEIYLCMRLRTFNSIPIHIFEQS